MVYYKELTGYIKELKALRDNYLDDWDLYDAGLELMNKLGLATGSEDPGYICYLYKLWIDDDRPEEDRVMTSEQKQAALFYKAADCEKEAKRLLNRAEELRIEAHKYN